VAAASVPEGITAVPVSTRELARWGRLDYATDTTPKGEQPVNNIKDALEKARSEAQDLHKQIEANTAKDHAALRTNVQNTGAQAQKLATSLRAVADGQRADAQQHIKDAAARLEDAAKHAGDVAGASEAQLKQTNQAMLGKARDAVQNLSQAIASRRAATVKV
jgi:hypothetical protein